MLIFRVKCPCGKKQFSLLYTISQKLNRFHRSAAFHIETSHLISSANQIISFYMKCNNGLKWINVLLRLSSFWNIGWVWCKKIIFTWVIMQGKSHLTLKCQPHIQTICQQIPANSLNTPNIGILMPKLTHIKLWLRIHQFGNSF